MATLTLTEIAQAIRDNGLPQIFGDFVRYTDFKQEDGLWASKIIGACAVGQAGINLNTPSEQIEYYLNEKTNDIQFPCPERGKQYPSFTYDRKCYISPTKFSVLVEHLNDDHQWTFKQIADYIDMIAKEFPHDDL